MAGFPIVDHGFGARCGRRAERDEIVATPLAVEGDKPGGNLSPTAERRMSMIFDLSSAGSIVGILAPNDLETMIPTDRKVTMARHEALVPLSHDHHHFLAHARRMQAAVTEDDSIRRRAADDFVSFYLGRGLRNMREEQELFFPAAFRDSRAHDLVLRAVEDHLEIHDVAKRLQRELSTGEISSDTLGEIADILPRHVRFEEGEVFPAIENAVPHEELHYLGAAGRRDV